jgi:hypothetical protein
MIAGRPGGRAARHAPARVRRRPPYGRSPRHADYAQRGRSEPAGTVAYNGLTAWASADGEARLLDAPSARGSPVVKALLIAAPGPVFGDPTVAFGALPFPW